MIALRAAQLLLLHVFIENIIDIFVWMGWLLFEFVAFTKENSHVICFSLFFVRDSVELLVFLTSRFVYGWIVLVIVSCLCYYFIIVSCSQLCNSLPYHLSHYLFSIFHSFRFIPSFADAISGNGKCPFDSTLSLFFPTRVLWRAGNSYYMWTCCCASTGWIHAYMNNEQLSRQRLAQLFKNAFALHNKRFTNAQDSWHWIDMVNLHALLGVDTRIALMVLNFIFIRCIKTCDFFGHP